jgi:hypothetical protein
MAPDLDYEAPHVIGANTIFRSICLSSTSATEIFVYEGRFMLSHQWSSKQGPPPDLAAVREAVRKVFEGPVPVIRDYCDIPLRGEQLCLEVVCGLVLDVVHIRRMVSV